jgi:rubrerythrin
MPEFATPFAGGAAARKLTDTELIRAIRYSIAAEYEAVQLYTQLAESTNDDRAVEVLIDVANEERVHAGEFLRLLRDLSPKEHEFYAHGAQEVEEMFQQRGGRKSESHTQEKGIDSHIGMPYCRLAADPEHSRGYVDEEPCHDSTSVTQEEIEET